jgi:hypothetical protein
LLSSLLSPLNLLLLLLHHRTVRESMAAAARKIPLQKKSKKSKKKYPDPAASRKQHVDRHKRAQQTEKHSLAPRDEMAAQPTISDCQPQPSFRKESWASLIGALRRSLCER